MTRRQGVIFLLMLGALYVLFENWPFLSIGPYGYSRLQLGMTEVEIAEVIGQPSEEYRRARHWGGMTSPGYVEVQFRKWDWPTATCHSGRENQQQMDRGLC